MNEPQTIYLNPNNPWSFEGHDNDSKNEQDDSEQHNYIHDYKYGPVKGNGDFPNGYVIVWGAIDQSVNGIYSSNAIYGNHIYNGPYMKLYKDNVLLTNKDNQIKHCLKFSRLKGIKIVPQIPEYVQYDEDDYYYDYGEDNRWNKSPKNDENIAHLRWDLINNTKKRLSNGENVSFTSEKNKKIKQKVSEQLQKHYDTLMNMKSFKYKYIYKWDNKLKKLVSTTTNNDFAYCAFIRDFAFDKHLYTQLAKCIPENYDYKQKREIKKKLLILNEYFNDITHFAEIVFSFLDVNDTCIHKCMTHIICMTEGKNNYWYTQRFVCDKCESIISIPDNDCNINEQLSFVSRVKRSFGTEINGRKSSHTPHLHSFKIRKWIADERFDGMTHENVSEKTIDIYNTDEISEMIDLNKIGIILKGERVYVYWKSKIGTDKDMIAIRTKDGTVGYCMVNNPDDFDISSDLKKLTVSFSEIEKFV
eukprot:449743_1